MATAGRFTRVVTDQLGNGVGGASVQIYVKGATLNGANNSVSTNANVTVYDVGAFPVTTFTCEIWSADGLTRRAATDGTFSFTGSVVDPVTVNLGGWSGTLTTVAKDRIVMTSSPPTVYTDNTEATTGTNPLTTEGTVGQQSSGIATCWLRGGAYDVKVSGTGVTTRIYYDEGVVATDMQFYYWPGTSSSAAAWKVTALRALTASDEFLRFSNFAGTPLWRIFGDGSWRSVKGGTIDAGGLTVTAGGITVSAGGIAVTGNSTITGTLTGLTGITSSGTAALATVTSSGGITISATGLNVTGGVTVSGSTGITQATSGVLNTIANLKATGSLFLTGRQTIASGSTINVNAGISIVELTGSTTVNTINLAGSAPGAGDDGRVLIIRDSDTGATGFGTSGNIYSAVGTLADGESVILCWNNGIGKWEYLAMH